MIVEVGAGEDVGVAGIVGWTVGDGGTRVGGTGFDGEQAENPPKSMSSIPIRFIA